MDNRHEWVERGHPLLSISSPVVINHGCSLIEAFICINPINKEAKKEHQMILLKAVGADKLDRFIWLMQRLSSFSCSWKDNIFEFLNSELERDIFNKITENIDEKSFTELIKIIPYNRYDQLISILGFNKFYKVFNSTNKFITLLKSIPKEGCFNIIKNFKINDVLKIMTHDMNREQFFEIVTLSEKVSYNYLNIIFNLNFSMMTKIIHENINDLLMILKRLSIEDKKAFIDAFLKIENVQDIISNFKQDDFFNVFIEISLNQRFDFINKLGFISFNTMIYSAKTLTDIFQRLDKKDRFIFFMQIDDDKKKRLIKDVHFYKIIKKEIFFDILYIDLVKFIVKCVVLGVHENTLTMMGKINVQLQNAINQVNQANMLLEKSGCVQKLTRRNIIKAIVLSLENRDEKKNAFFVFLNIKFIKNKIMGILESNDYLPVILAKINKIEVPNNSLLFAVLAILNEMKKTRPLEDDNQKTKINTYHIEGFEINTNEKLSSAHKKTLKEILAYFPRNNNHEKYIENFLAFTPNEHHTSNLLALAANAVDSCGNTMLGVVCEYGYSVEAVEKLIDIGARLNDIDRNGRTALYWSIYNQTLFSDKDRFDPKKTTAVLAYLLENGADPSILCYYGKTALEYAKIHKVTAATALLSNFRMRKNARNVSMVPTTLFYSTDISESGNIQKHDSNQLNTPSLG